MAKLKHPQAVPNKRLILPTMGEVELDDECCLEVEDESLIGSLVASGWVNLDEEEEIEVGSTEEGDSTDSGDEDDKGDDSKDIEEILSDMSLKDMREFAEENSLTDMAGYKKAKKSKGLMKKFIVGHLEE